MQLKNNYTATHQTNTFTGTVPNQLELGGKSFNQREYPDLQTTGSEMLGFADKTSTAIRNIQNSDWDYQVIAKSVEILHRFQNLLNRMPNRNHLSNIRARLVDDGSILLDWIFPDYRIGISVEENFMESNWYIVSNATRGNIEASGDLVENFLNQIVYYLVCFAIIND